VIDRKFSEAAAFALVGAVLTFFGFMHGEAIGIAVTPTVAIAYLMVAAFIYGLSRYPEMISMEMPAPKPVPHAQPAE
jgi:AGZA family xanthine/uracil permease-like MFS transporter